MYHFLSGFTAKLAGTEIGVTEPEPTFSPCFGGAVPAAAARRSTRGCCGEKLARAQARPCGSSTPAGPAARPATAATGCRSRRRARCCTRRSPARSTSVEYRTDAVFGFEVPVAVPGVDATLLDPRSTWGDPAAYDAKARELAAMFRDELREVRGRRPRGRRGRAAVPRRDAHAFR